jgi:hypothetical protein
MHKSRPAKERETRRADLLFNHNVAIQHPAISNLAIRRQRFLLTVLKL